MKKLAYFFNNNRKTILSITFVLLIILFLMPIFTTKRLSRNKEYTKKEDVALYIMQYHELPKNYITKYGIETSYHVNNVLDGKVMGGDTHWNNGYLEKMGISKNVSLKECDIYFDGYKLFAKNGKYDSENSNRGEYRLVYTCNVKRPRVIFSRHYKHDQKELTNFNLQLTRNIFWIIFGVYSLGFVSYYSVILYYNKKNQLIINGGNNNE